MPTLPRTRSIEPQKGFRERGPARQVPVEEGFRNSLDSIDRVKRRHL